LSTAPALSPAAEKRASTLIYTASFTYAISLGAMQVLVPLYGLHLGYDIKALGFILSAQAVLPILTRFFAGAIADMFGDRWVLWFSFSTMVLGALLFASSGVIGALIAAQTLQGLSRSTYWTVTQSYVSRINPAMVATRLGRLSSSGNAGTVIGTAGAGILAETAGYGYAFSAVAGAAAIGFVGSIGLPLLPRSSAKRSFKAALAPIPAVAKTKAMGMAGFSAFIGSSSVMLGIILVVPFVEESSIGESEIGFARTLSGIGSLTAGLLFGRLIMCLGLRNLHAVAFTLQGVTFLAMPLLVSQFWSGLPVMYAYGLFGGIMGSLYPMSASTFSRTEHRGTAMGYAGQFWGVAQLVVPISFGFIATSIGLESSLYLSGFLFIGLAVLAPVVHRALTRSWMQRVAAEAEASSSNA
jgi:MFS family permease